MLVYVIGSARGPKKVGLSNGLRQRLRSVQTGNESRLKVLLAEEVPDASAAAIERRAHWLLRDARKNGEWFAVSAKAAIAAVTQAIAEGGEGEKAKPAVGRPPLNVKVMPVRLPAGMAERIDAIAGENRRAEFIREAVERELKRRERQKDKPE